MPYIAIETNAQLDDSTQSEVLKELSLLTSTALSKGESYVMVSVDANKKMLFSGTEEALAFVTLKSLGLPTHKTGELAQLVCEFLMNKLNINGDRVYIEFASPERNMWGWNSKTFG